MYHLTPVLKAMTLSPIRAIIHREAHCPPPAFLTKRTQERDALRAGAAFLAFYFAFLLLARITDRPQRVRGPRVKLSPRNSRQLRIRPGHGRLRRFKEKEKKRGKSWCRAMDIIVGSPSTSSSSSSRSSRSWIGCDADRRGFTLRLRLDAAAVSCDENLRDHDEGLFLRG